MDYNKIKEAAQNYEADMTKFLRELVHFPGESCGEKDHVMRIKEEMEKLGKYPWLYGNRKHSHRFRRTY